MRISGSALEELWSMGLKRTWIVVLEMGAMFDVASTITEIKLVAIGTLPVWINSQ
jgi:hypothetical protein